MDLQRNRTNNVYREGDRNIYYAKLAHMTMGPGKSYLPSASWRLKKAGSGGCGVIQSELEGLGAGGAYGISLSPSGGAVQTVRQGGNEHIPLFSIFCSIPILSPLDDVHLHG